MYFLSTFIKWENGPDTNSNTNSLVISSFLELWRRARRIFMKKYTVLVTEQFVRDRRMVLHAQNESDLELRVADMTEAEGRRLDADDSQVVEVFILDEKTVL